MFAMVALLGLACRAPDEASPPNVEAPSSPEPTAPTTGEEPSPTTRVVSLSVAEAMSTPLTLEMTRDEVAELLGPIAADLKLLDLAPEVLLGAAIDQIRDACGSNFEGSDPDFDCAATDLGRSFGPDWASTPEFAMVRLLAMTPDNARVEGTSLEGVAATADALNIGGGFGQVLADTLERELDDLAVGTEALVEALRDGWLASHPAVSSDGRLPVTLADALSDLDTLATTLGPANGHPGIVNVDPPPFGQVLADDFGMALTMDSNLAVLDGLDLSAGGKGYLVASSGSDPVEFDFLDPDRFAITGLVDGPTVDLSLTLNEAPTKSIACEGDVACYDNLPGQPVGTESVWSFEPWTLEWAIADAARRENEGRVYERTYTFLIFIPAVTVGLGQEGAPPGFLSFDVLADIGDPPDEQYIWELLLEVAEVNLHAFDTYAFDEGQANPSFDLSGLPTGLTVADVEAAVRTNLQAQSSTIADALFGDFQERSDPVDLVFALDPNGTPALQIVVADDLPAATPAPRPGFFEDAALNRRVSTSLGKREGWYPPVGSSTVFVQDAWGGTYRLDVEASSPFATTIDVAIQAVP